MTSPEIEKYPSENQNNLELARFQSTLVLLLRPTVMQSWFCMILCLLSKMAVENRKYL